MPRGTSNEDRTMLSMALLGYESERQRIEEKIQELQARLNGRSSVVSSRKVEKAGSSSEAVESPKRRTLSPAARKRIAAAQKKRWAEHRKQAAAASEE